jgi:alpha-galactosidase
MLVVGNGWLTTEEEETHFALWAFAKAPLIIGTPLDSIPQSSLAILQNKWLLGINQDLLGNQAVCNSGCDTTLHVYQALVSPNSKDGLYMGVLAVNWDDAQAQTLTLNFVDAGIASTDYDSCTVIDLWTGEVTKTNGGDHSYPDIPAHGNIALQIKCLPF